MSIRIDPNPLIAGAIVIGVAALGVLGSQVPLTGEHGGGLLANDIVLPAEADDEFRVLILTAPAGTLFVYEDSSFVYTGPGGSGTYEGFKNGISFGVAGYTITSDALGTLSGAFSFGAVAPAGTLSGGVASALSGQMLLQDIALGGSLSSTAQGTLTGVLLLAPIVASGVVFVRADVASITGASSTSRRRARTPATPVRPRRL